MDLTPKLTNCKNGARKGGYLEELKMASFAKLSTRKILPALPALEYGSWRRHFQPNDPLDKRKSYGGGYNSNAPFGRRGLVGTEQNLIRRDNTPTDNYCPPPLKPVNLISNERLLHAEPKPLP
ncbi:hypothetical protein RvY_17406 [Ramazzottius varieornatus]|uniref:Uncharacterized protein n=1 Tax=Ramazzottius varieornatus TaxID=947166 RepID=A0A1D1W1Z9_RAMVA|nr:hypothetical protein RvY_17406 [Ramazzottius varieornatus]